MATAARVFERTALPSRLWLLLPVTFVYGALALLPFALIVQFSFADGVASYRKVLASPLLLHVVENTVVISVTTTLAAVLLAYLLAAGMWRSGTRVRTLFTALVLLPFWTSVLIKNFAWLELLQHNGVINHLLEAIGIVHGPLPLLNNRLAVIIGMTHYVLPYAVFLIYNAMSSIDDRLERAARSLGASSAAVFRSVILPLTLPATWAAALLVFIICTGFFITPVILGSPSDMMISNLVDFYAHVVVDFGRASAIAVLTVAAVSVLVVAYVRIPKESQYGTF